MSGANSRKTLEIHCVMLTIGNNKLFSESADKFNIVSLYTKLCWLTDEYGGVAQSMSSYLMPSGYEMDMYGDAPDKMTYTEQANKRTHCKRLTRWTLLLCTLYYCFKAGTQNCNTATIQLGAVEEWIIIIILFIIIRLIISSSNSGYMHHAKSDLLQLFLHGKFTVADGGNLLPSSAWL